MEAMKIKVEMKSNIEQTLKLERLYKNNVKCDLNSLPHMSVD